MLDAFSKKELVILIDIVKIFNTFFIIIIKLKLVCSEIKVKSYVKE